LAIFSLSFIYSRYVLSAYEYLDGVIALS